MDAPLPAKDYWGTPAAVERFERNHQVLPFELDLLATASRSASRTGPLERIQVVGVGAGRELPAVREVAPGATIEASDISGPMIEACRRSVERRGMQNVTLTEAALEDLVPQRGHADVVVAINAVLCYLTTQDQRDRAAVALAGLLRPGGAIAVVVQQRNARPDWAAFFALRSLATRLGWAPGAPGDRRNDDELANLLVHHYTRRELRTLLTGAGFVDVRLTSLRRWGRANGHRIRWRSPNPLLLSATLGPAEPA